MNYNIKEVRAALKDGTLTSVALVKNAIATFESDKSSDLPLNAFLEMYDDA